MNQKHSFIILNLLAIVVIFFFLNEETHMITEKCQIIKCDYEMDPTCTVENSQFQACYILKLTFCKESFCVNSTVNSKVGDCRGGNTVSCGYDNRNIASTLTLVSLNDTRLTAYQAMAFFTFGVMLIVNLAVYADHLKKTST